MTRSLAATASPKAIPPEATQPRATLPEASPVDFEVYGEAGGWAKKPSSTLVLIQCFA